VALIICDGDVTIKGAEAVRKSYPTFFDEFELLGGNIERSDT
jgi:3-phosphoshikimate 1-carboxyvinyltransferase